MSIITINCVDADNTSPLAVSGLDALVARPVDVTYHYGLARKPRPGKIWKMSKVGKITVFDQWSSFDFVGIRTDSTAVMIEV